MKIASTKEDGRPATMWYWDDWFSSFDVRDCCLAARGLWIDMLGIMAKSEVKGCLILSGGRQVDSKSMAKFSGCSEKEVEVLWHELEEHRVFDRLSDGTIINRRMFNESKRQKRLANIRSKAGRIGAKVRWQIDANTDATDIATHEDEDEYYSSSSLRNKKDKSPKIILILDEEPKRWEGIKESDKVFWTKTYPGCDIDKVLQEMIAYWDAQPKSKRKLNWKRTIVNRLQWLQDHGGTKKGKQSIEDWAKEYGREHDVK